MHFSINIRKLFLDPPIQWVIKKTNSCWFIHRRWPAPTMSLGATGCVYHNASCNLHLMILNMAPRSRMASVIGTGVHGL
jgi:hypothetical protein